MVDLALFFNIPAYSFPSKGFNLHQAVDFQGKLVFPTGQWSQRQIETGFGIVKAVETLRCWNGSERNSAENLRRALGVFYQEDDYVFKD